MSAFPRLFPRSQHVRDGLPKTADFCAHQSNLAFPMATGNPIWAREESHVTSECYVRSQFPFPLERGSGSCRAIPLTQQSSNNGAAANDRNQTCEAALCNPSAWRKSIPRTSPWKRDGTSRIPRIDLRPVAESRQIGPARQEQAASVLSSHRQESGHA